MKKLFQDIKVGQRFVYNSNEYLKVTEIRVTCCKIESNAIKLKNNEKILFEYKAEVESIDD